MTKSHVFHLDINNVPLKTTDLKVVQGIFSISLGQVIMEQLLGRLWRIGPTGLSIPIILICILILDGNKIKKDLGTKIQRITKHLNKSLIIMSFIMNYLINKIF